MLRARTARETEEELTATVAPAASPAPAGIASETAAKAHLFASVAFIGLSLPLGFAALLTLRFPGMFGGLSYGRLRPAFMIAVCLGALFLSFTGGIYYVLPRVTGAVLRGEALAQLALPASVAVYLAGILLVLLGFGDGREPFGLPWWLDLAVLATVSVPAIVTFLTLRERIEPRQFPSVWYAVGGTLALPILYIVGNLPGTTQVAAALGDRAFMAGFNAIWVVGVGTGLAYYAVVKSTEQPLASRNLARIGFWSLMFGAVWQGPAQLAMGPVPEWVVALAAFDGLAVVVACLANATCLALTMGSAWRRRREYPAALAALSAAGLAAAWSIVSSVASFRAALAMTDLTLFWEGTSDLVLLGAGGLFAAAWTYQALPNLFGRALFSDRLALTNVRSFTIGATGLALLLILGGIASGYGWAGGANAGAYVSAGPGWEQSAGPARLMLLLAVIPAAILGWGTVAFVRNVFLTYVRGRATVQEVLVPTGGADD
jgi:cbb3-type cytochrome oxidase subunit 1